MKDLAKVERVIDSCETRQQLNVAVKYLGLYQARELRRKDQLPPRSFAAILSNRNNASRKLSELYALLCRSERKSKWIEWGERRSLEGILTGQ
jgi:hypothetical protein